MFDKAFFDNNWVGRIINLTTVNPPSAWKLVTKLSDKHLQWSAEEYHHKPATSSAYDSFLCHNAGNSDDVAVMRIFTQIPYEGSEYAIHGERARQATDIPNRTTRMS